MRTVGGQLQSRRHALRRCVAFCCLGIIGCAQHAPEKISVRPANPAQGHILTDTEGRRWDLNDPAHKVVLVDFWSTTCGPCLKAMPAMHALYAELHPAGLVMVSVNSDGKREQAEHFLKRHPFPNPVVFDDGATWRSWEVKRLPTLFLMRDGVVLRKWEGSIPVEEIAGSIRQLQGKSSANANSSRSVSPRLTVNL